MQNIDPITIIIFIPILDRFLYPKLRRVGIALRPIFRITLGFMFGALAMMYAAYVQQLIYSAPPCFSSPLTCAASKLPDGTIAHNKARTNAAPGVLGNDDNGGAAITAALVKTTSHGTLSLSSNGAFTYTPNTGYSGTDTFTYQAVNSVGKSNVATVTLTVQ